MHSQYFDEVYRLLQPRKIELAYLLDGYYFKIQGVLQEVIFYDEEEPYSDTRIVVRTDLDDFDIEMRTVDYIRRIDVP